MRPTLFFYIEISWQKNFFMIKYIKVGKEFRWEKSYGRRKARYSDEYVFIWFK